MASQESLKEEKNVLKQKKKQGPLLFILIQQLLFKIEDVLQFLIVI